MPDDLKIESSRKSVLKRISQEDTHLRISSHSIIGGLATYNAIRRLLKVHPNEK